MNRTTRSTLVGMAVCALLSGTIASLRAATILKLDLGGSGPDVGQKGGGEFGTFNDGDATTTGDQDTNIEFTSFLDPLFADVTSGNGSFTITGPLIASPTPTSTIPGTPSLVIQGYPAIGNLPTFSLYGPGNTLLLTGPTGSVNLVGTLGPPGTGGVISTTLQTVTGGTLKPYLADNSVSISISLSNINGGAGLSLNTVEGIRMNPYVADGFVTITAQGANLPEPTSIALLALGAMFATGVSRRSRRDSCVA